MKAIASPNDFTPCLSIVMTFLTVLTIGPKIAVATVVNIVVAALNRCRFKFPTKFNVASLMDSSRVLMLF